jgi:hypothetical protein
MVYDAPVTIPAAGEASQPTRAATSSGSSSRLIALCFSKISATLVMKSVAEGRPLPL